MNLKGCTASKEWDKNEMVFPSALYQYKTCLIEYLSNSCNPKYSITLNMENILKDCNTLL